MKLAEMRGLLFPDIYVCRFFFNTECNKRTGRVLELGCGNGNNLMLFSHFGWDVVGVDSSPQAIEWAFHNFESEQLPEEHYRFLVHDLAQGLPSAVTGTFDVVLIPNFLYYLERGRAHSLLNQLIALVKQGSYVFVSARTHRDYRYGRGALIGRDTFRLNIDETGEKGLISVFYHDHELVDMLRRFLSVDDSSIQILHADYETVQQNVIASNSDVIIWGRLDAQ